MAKTFPLKETTFTALDEVSLDVADEEFVTVVGPSGCGKSTLLEHGRRAGRTRPPGEVLVDGQPVTGPGPDRGVIFQQYALFPWLTVRGNVEFGLQAGRILPAAERQRPGRARHRTGRPHRLRRRAAQDAVRRDEAALRDRPRLRRSIPQVLLMDEPFGALDALTRVQLQDQLLDTWSREQRTVLFVTHDVDEAVYLASARRRDGRPAGPDPDGHRRRPALSADRRASGSPPSSPGSATPSGTAVYHQAPAASAA